MAGGYCAIVPAAGTGKRFGGATPKQYLPLHGVTVIEHSLRLLLSVSRLEHIVVVIHPEDTRWRDLSVFSDPRIDTAIGGAERCHSVLNGLAHLRQRYGDCEWALVHDVARPCCLRADIEKLMMQVERHPVGGILATPASDTIKRVDSARQIEETVDRSWLWQAQTPQLLRMRLLFDALNHCIGMGMTVTDEAQAVEALGWQAQVVEGSRGNIKITRPEDLALAEFFLQRQALQQAAMNA
ncbi:MAG TPA: 2-C-methyl-D-erythritol 4-phosphate cytidylyltransferase [Spongiibacteraceae bacterium]|nr:2-C-methyl-D-erythritol 4-phosphate cytidylyltransferase [Spongiibacteraceae bacterium]